MSRYRPPRHSVRPIEPANNYNPGRTTARGRSNNATLRDSDRGMQNLNLRSPTSSRRLSSSKKSGRWVQSSPDANILACGISNSGALSAWIPNLGFGQAQDGRVVPEMVPVSMVLIR